MRQSHLWFSSQAAPHRFGGAVDRTGVFAVCQIEAKEELRKPAQDGHRHPELENLSVAEMRGKLVMQLLGHIPVEVGEHHLLAQPQHGAVARRKYRVLNIVRQGVNLLRGEASLSRRDSVDPVS